MIRLYQEKDIEEVVESWYQASCLAHSFLSDRFFEEEEINLRELFLPNSETWVKEINGRVVGFISLIIKEKHGEAEVGGLFIHPEWQRQGIGQALMDKARADYPILELDVFAANTQGRAFYQKYGFTYLQQQRDQATEELSNRLRYDHTTL